MHYLWTRSHACNKLKSIVLALLLNLYIWNIHTANSYKAKTTNNNNFGDTKAADWTSTCQRGFAACVALSICMKQKQEHTSPNAIYERAIFVDEWLLPYVTGGAGRRNGCANRPCVNRGGAGRSRVLSPIWDDELSVDGRAWLCVPLCCGYLPSITWWCSRGGWSRATGASEMAAKFFATLVAHHVRFWKE